MCNSGLFLVSDCIGKSFEEFYQSVSDRNGKCTLPWTLSLMKTSTNATVPETPCSDTDFANLQTLEIQDFFGNARNYDVDGCKGIILS